MARKELERHGLRLLLAFLLAAAPSYAQEKPDQTQEDAPTSAALTAILPSPSGGSEFPSCQPLNVSLNGSDASHGIVRLRVDVESNPPDHKHVLSADFDEAAQVTQIQTRVRLAGSGEAIVKVTALTRSGNELNTTVRILVGKGVNFSDETSLTRRLPMNKGPVGTARARLSKEDSEARKLQAILFHPMLPAIGSKQPKSITSLHIQYRDKSLANFYFGTAMSNDPYIRLDFKEAHGGAGSIRIQWKEDTGNVFEPEAISVK